MVAGTRVREVWLDSAVGRLSELEGLQRDVWSTLDIYEKRIILNQVGRTLGEIYDHPAPPLLIEDLEDETLQGFYADGYVFNEQSERVEGSDYGMKLNARAERDHERLFGDDPTLALETYAHEFRHSYQAEQVARSRKTQFRNLVDNTESARKWDHEYVSPESDYEEYCSQPVEKDARDFAEELVRRLYSRR
jgi:hypothetical protein